MKTLLIITVFCVSGLMNVSGQERSQEMLNKAIYEEEVNGNLEEAIEVYQTILNRFSDNRPVAAQAQFHIGICYEKLGLKEAQKAYEKVVNNYPDQPSEVALAKERLTRLIIATEKILKAPLVPKFTKINIPAVGELGALSPDGKNLVLVSDKKLWKIPLSGNLGPDFPGIPDQLNTDGVEVPGWGSLSWSQNGKWIAFNVDESIYVVSSDGGKPKKVIESYRDVEALNYRISLSANGNKLAFSSVEENKQHIFSTPVDKVIPRQLVEMEAREPVFSPDEKYIAFVKDQNKGSGWGNLGLWVVEANGGKPHKIADAGKAHSPVWSPDGKLIAFLDGDVKNKINIVPFSKTADAIDKVIRIDAPEGVDGFILLAGWTHENKIGAISRKNEKYGLYTMPVEGGQAAIILHNALATQPRWSKNGEQIYFVTTPKKMEGRGYNLASVSASGGKGKPLKTNYKGKYINQLTFQSGNRLSPDGKWIVTSTWTHDGTKNTINVDWPTSRIWKVSVDGEDAIQLTDTPGNFFESSPCWSADGEKIAFVQTELVAKDIFGDSRIYIIDSNGGEPELLDPDAGIWAKNLIWSPDGKMIAYSTGKRSINETQILKIIDIESRDIRVIEEVLGSSPNNEMVWSPDSKRIAYDAGNVIEIMNIDDGSIEDIETELPDLSLISLDWSPDGKSFVFAGRASQRNEFWFMENFLPLEKIGQVEEIELASYSTTTKKVMSGESTIVWGNVSPNGRFLTYSDPATLNLAVRDLTTGKSSVLTKDASENPIQFNMASVVSPKSDQIAYAWYKNNHEVRITDINGSQPRTLYSSENEDIWPCAWSPDGKTIYARSILNASAQSRILAIDAGNGEIKTIKSFEGIFWTQLDISSDNRFLAYDYPNYKNGEFTDFDIHLISTDGEIESVLTDHPADDKILGWIPGKNQLLFKSNRSGAWDAWTIEVINGKVIGEPRRVLAEIGENASQMGFTNKGAFYFSLMFRKFNGSVLPFDQTKGELKSESAKPLLGSIAIAKWSPDGKSIAFIKEKWARDQRPVYVYDAETGHERLLTNDFYLRDLNWLADNSTLLFLGNDKRRESEKNYSGGIYTINVQTSEINEVLAFSDYGGKDWEIGLKSAQMLAQGNPGQKNIYYLKDGQLICRNLASGEEKIILKDPGLKSDRYTLDPSPDGQNLLYNNYDQIYIIPATGEKQISVTKVNTTTGGGQNVSNSAVWSPDMNYLFYTENKGSEGSVIWRINGEGENKKEVWQSKLPILSFSIHPNGKEIVITAIDVEAEIWKMENFLPKE